MRITNTVKIWGEKEMSRTANNSISGQGKQCLYGTMKVTYKRCHGNAE